MQTTVLGPQKLTLSDFRINFGLTPILKEKSKEENKIHLSLFKTLPDKKLNCLTNAKIEHVICTSILSASM